MNCNAWLANIVVSLKNSTQHVTTLPRNIFGRRKGRPLKKERREALEELLPKFEIAKKKLTEDHSCLPDNLFHTPYSSYWLEIGFGQGEHVIALSERNTETGYLGAEPFINGMAVFLKNTKDRNTDNVRVLMDDGMIIARSLGNASLDGIYILNPDPWHKKRHHKRRIINRENLDIFAKILKPGGQLVMTTDVENLAKWMCTYTGNHPDFIWQAGTIEDCLTPPENWIPTRYEQKGAKGSKKMIYLIYKRK
ncbi:MAG: tRNA (guanosine(46)-N7)-methyltransferase TrmB [Alphaproteobacteria bacterium]|nr:tRNA (guanosine(46)-N7)-methyltransferase TrmB [Alphaproteobacteria bacterium]